MQKKIHFRSGRNNQRRRRRLTRKQSLACRVIALALVLVILLIVILVQSCTKEQGLVGRWSIDDVTLYEFSEDGKGAMIVPSETYQFSYKKQENKISIDFESEFAADKSYTYEIKGDTLTLTGEGKFGGVYTMTRIEK